MSFEESSNTNPSLDMSNKRIRESYEPAPQDTTVQDAVEDAKSPMQAMLMYLKGRLQKLHPILQSHLQPQLELAYRQWSAYFHKDAKHQELLRTHGIMTSAKTLNLVLQPLEEVKESEEYNTLNATLLAELEVDRRKYSDNYSMKLDDMNRLALLKRWQRT